VIIDIFGQHGDKIGTADVRPDVEEVDFYLKPGFALRDDVKKKLAKQLKAMRGRKKS
jgi:hypothetical protein